MRHEWLEPTLNALLIGVIDAIRADWLVAYSRDVHGIVREHCLAVPASCKVYSVSVVHLVTRLMIFRLRMRPCIFAA
jgi:hypothetical protein